MLARVLYGVALLGFCVSLVGIALETREVAPHATEVARGIPADLYEPPSGDDGSTPVVVLVHPVAGNAGLMSVQARHLARAGYAVIVPEMSGHGRSLQPFSWGSKAAPARWVDELEATTQFVRMHPGLDGERIAVIGHAAGAEAALTYAGRDPSLAAVIGLSGAVRPTGPYPIPNVLLLWGSRTADRTQARYRSIAAELAGHDRVVLDRTYGETQRGTGVRASELDGVGALTILYSAEAAGRLVAWLAETLGPGLGPVATPRADGRLGYGLLGVVAVLGLLWGLVRVLTPLLPRAALPSLGSVPGRLAELATALLASLVVVAVSGPEAGHGPASFLPLIGARDVVGVLAVSGGGLWIWLARSGRMSMRGLWDGRTWTQHRPSPA